MQTLVEEEVFNDLFQADDWENVAYWNFKSSFIECNDSVDAAINLNTPEGHDTHLNLALCIDEHNKQAGIFQRIEESDLLVCETIRTLLSATRPLTWC